MLWSDRKVHAYVHHYYTQLSGSRGLHEQVAKWFRVPRSVTVGHISQATEHQQNITSCLTELVCPKADCHLP